MRRKHWIGTVAMTAFAAAALAATAFAGKENLLRNGGFEQGMEGWKVEDVTSTMKVEIDGKVCAEGKSSAHVVKPPSNGISNDRLVLEVTKLPRGKKVVLTAQVKGKDLQNTWLKLFVFDAKGESIVDDCDVGRVSGTFDWREMKRKFELPKEAVRAEVRFCMFLGGEAWIDDVQLVGDAAAAKDSAPAATTGTSAAPSDSAGKENLLRNGSFEAGMDGWKVENQYSTMKVEIDGEVRAEGKSAAHVVKPPSKGLANDRLACEVTKVPAGKSVRLAARVKGKDLQNTWLKLFVFDSKGESILEDCDVGRVSGTFDWQEIDRTFELPKEAVRAEVRFCMFLGGEAWIDDVRLTEDTTGPAPAAKTAAPAAPLDPATKKWLDENAVRVKTLDPKEPLDDLAPLKSILEDARIVQLGENTHGDGACFEAKARLIRFLHEEMGFEVLAFESGLWECDRANELLRKGDADGAMRSSIFPIWHTKPVSGLFRYLGERAKTDRPLVLAGFDCRRSAGEANRFLDELPEFLAPAGKPDAADVAALKRLETLMWEQGDDYAPSAEEVSAAAEAWDRLRKALDAGKAKLAEKHGEAETALVSRALDNWKENEAFERSKKSEGSGKWTSNNLRDTRMAANLRWLAETRYPGKKIVTWGATFHLCHGIGGVEAQGRKDLYEGCVNMGGPVHEAFGASAYTIGFAAHGGKWALRFNPKPVPMGAPKEGSVEDLLHRYGAPYLFVDLRRKGPFSEPMPMAPMGYDRSMRARWPEVLDAVFFIDEMTPAR